MHKWLIDIILKGSGTMLHCLYEGPEEVSSDVIKKVFLGRELTEAVALARDDCKSQVWFMIGEVAAMDIRPKK